MVTNARSQVESTSASWQVSAAWVALTWGLLIGPILISLALPPQHDTPNSSDVTSLASGSTGALENAVISGVHLMILTIGAGAIILSTRFVRPLGAGAGLWFGAMALSIGPVISSLFSTGLFLPPDVIRLPLFFTAAYLLPPVHLEWFVSRCKSAIELYAVATLAAAILVPSRALQMDYDLSLVEGFTYRLHGIANHANNYAPILLVYLVLGWIVPARTTRDWLIFFLIAGSLLLTQSKTVFAATLVLYAIRFFYVKGFARYLIVYAGAVFSVASLLVLTYVRPTWDRGLVDFFIADNAFTTLTGRTTVWAYGMDLWREKRIFGYGIDFWYVEMSENFAAIYSWVPHHAHNQVVQTLGESGLVGLGGLVMFLSILIVKGIRYSRLTHGASLALVAFLILRGITEAPISGSLDENLFALFVTFTILMLADRATEESTDERPAHSDQPAGGGRLSPSPLPTSPHAAHTSMLNRTPGQQLEPRWEAAWQAPNDSNAPSRGPSTAFFNDFGNAGAGPLADAYNEPGAGSPPPTQRWSMMIDAGHQGVWTRERSTGHE